MIDDHSAILFLAALHESGLAPEALDGRGVGLMPGANMEPTIKDSGPIIYEPCKDVTESGEVYVIRTEPGVEWCSNTLTAVRRIFAHEDGSYTFRHDSLPRADERAHPTGECDERGWEVYQKCCHQRSTGRFSLRILGRVIYPTQLHPPANPLSLRWRTLLRQHQLA